MKVENESDLLEPMSLSEFKPCKAVCVIKPNQNFNVVIRVLKSFANLNPEGVKKKDYKPFVTIAKIDLVD